MISRVRFHDPSLSNSQVVHVFVALFRYSGLKLYHEGVGTVFVPHFCSL